MSTFCIVIDIDDTVEVVLVPAELASRARAATPPAEQRRMLQLIGLLFARLGAEIARPLVETWLTRSPQALLAFPDPLRRALVDGTIASAAPHTDLHRSHEY